MIFKTILVTAIPVIVIAGLYWTHRPKMTVRVIEPSWRNADTIGDGAAPWSGTVQAKYPDPYSVREREIEIEPRGM